MTDTDGVIGTVGGLLALGIVANAAAKAINPKIRETRPARPVKPIEHMKVKHMHYKHSKGGLF